LGQEQIEKKDIQPPLQASAPRDTMLVKVNRQNGEVVFTDPTGKEFALKLEQEEPEPERSKPLTVEEFKQVWGKLNELGITWTTDIPPEPRYRPDWKPTATFTKEYRELQEKYPTFPRELSRVILHKLLHKPSEKAEQKAVIISDLLTQEYRSEFFFKYAIKVPYFEDIDWEVVIKAYERGAHAMPKIAYALLALTFREPVDTSLNVEDAANEYREPEFITVAVNEPLIDNLIDKLTTIKNALVKAQIAADSLTEVSNQEEDASNGGSNI